MESKNKEEDKYEEDESNPTCKCQVPKVPEKHSVP